VEAWTAILLTFDGRTLIEAHSLGHVPDKHPFPLWQSVLVLTATACVVFAGAWWMVPALFGRGPDDATAMAGAAVVAWAASLMGIIPMALFYERGLLPTVQGVFLGMAARVIICVGATVAALWYWRIPGGPWATTLLSIYLSLLFVEVLIIGRLVWSIQEPDRDGTTDCPQDPGGLADNPAVEVLA